MKTLKLMGCIFILCINFFFVNAQDSTSGYIPFFQQKVDFNKDKLMDSVVFLEKENKQDGDSILVVFYQRKIDGTLLHFKTFGNLFPLYFKSYNIDYEMQSKSLENIFKNYVQLNPTTEIMIKDRKITIVKKPTAITYYYEFVFDLQRNNWYLSTHKTSSSTFTSPTERYFFNDAKAIPLEKYHFLLHIKE